MSRAIVFHEYGDPSVLTLVDVEPPPPEPGTVLLRVKAAGLQPFDNLFRSGAMAAFMPATFPQGIGKEAAGVVEAVGSGVTRFAPGDEVLGWVESGAVAEHVVVPADQLVRKPPAMPWAEAGALSASGQTAHTALTHLAVKAGETVLIHAAAGGVGGHAVQIAVAWGAKVIGTASPRNHDYLRSLGATPVAYGEGLADRVREMAPDGVDASFDAIATDEALATAAALVADPERRTANAFNPAMARHGVHRLQSERTLTRLTELVELYESGGLRVEIAGTYPLTETAAAQHAVAGGHTRGKIVVII